MIWGRILPNFFIKSSTLTKACLHYQSILVSRFNSDNVGHQIRHVSAKPRFDFGGIREPNDGRALFQEMLRMRPLPPLVDFTQLFGVLVSMKQYSLAFQMLDEMLQRDASIKRSTFNIVMPLFHKMVRMHPPPSVVDYNKFWSGVIKIKQYSVALHLFHEMLRMDAPVNHYSFNIAINCFCCLRRPDYGFAILGRLFKHGYEPNVVCFNTLMKGLMLVGKIQEAAKLLGKLLAMELRMYLIVFASTIISIVVAKLLTPIAKMAFATPQKGKTEVLKFDSEEDVAAALAKYTADLSEKFVKEKGSFSVVLSGGTLIDTMRKLVESPYKESVDWSKWLIFWVDERVVPLDHEDSNYLLAWRGFLSKVPIPPGNIYAINEKLSPEGAADDYEERLRLLVESKVLPVSSITGFPKFDLMLLGMGPDGHVASLFPSRHHRYEKKRWVTFITDSPKPPPPRITFTFPVINSASEIAMVITGAELADTTKIVLGTGPTPGSPPLPATEVSAEGELTWFLDKDAASKL